MPRYKVNNNAQLNADYEVHKAGYIYTPRQKDYGRNVKRQSVVKQAKGFIRQPMGEMKLMPFPRFDTKCQRSLFSSEDNKSD